MPTKIEWTDESWNPITGCDPISDGCDHCYAKRMAYRLAGRFGYDKEKPFSVTIHGDKFRIPFGWKKPRMIFVCSMGDLFHRDVSFYYIRRIADIMRNTPRHIYQVLTKRSKRMVSLCNDFGLEFSNNVWVGVTVENNRTSFRIDDLLQINASVKFVSYEPLLSSISNPVKDGLDWVIVGGETGSGARKMEAIWARNIKNICVDKGVPFFFKQWGGKRKKDRILDGRTWDQFPERTAKK